MSDKRLELTLLGGFALRVDGIAVPLTPTLQRLMALLALTDKPMTRTKVEGILWGDSSDMHAQGSLRSALWKLRGSVGIDLVTSSGDTLALSERVEVDATTAVKVATSLILGRFGEHDLTLLEPRMQSELLPGWYDDWVLVERERHRQVTLHALELLCEHLTAICHFGAAVLAGLSAVSREPLRESAYRALIRAYLAEGNAGEAIRMYGQYAAVAAAELNVEPSPLLKELLYGIQERDRSGSALLA